MLRRVVFLVIVLVIYPFFCFAEEDEIVYQLEPVFVRPLSCGEGRNSSLRHVEYINNPQDKIEQNTAELIKHFSSIDMVHRGPEGIQSDLQIRGATFEQTDILLDGIKVNDPQTGHFNIDLPLFIEDIDTIAAIAGPAANVYGAGSQGGSVHIISKKPEKEKLQAKAVFGEHRFSSQSLSYTYPLGAVNSRSTLGRFSSEGYRYNTDFDTVGFSHFSCIDSGYGDLQFSFNFLDKEFGANSFYSEFYPEQREHTKTIFTSLGINSELADFSLNPKVYLRRHQDHYLLDRTMPGWSENFHTNYVTGAKVDCVREFSTGKVFLGTDLAEEKIDSTNLKKHQRMRYTLYSGYNLGINRWLFSGGLTGYWYENFNSHILPDVGIGYWLADGLKIRSAFNRSFRAPTFTELYYQSPANMGNENLVPEKSKNFEVGIDYLRERFSSSATLFTRKEKNLIDWVRTQTATVYQAENVSHVDTDGLELNFKLFPEKINPHWKGWKGVSLCYTTLDREEKQNDLVSKYVFDYLKHKFVLDSEHKIPFDLTTKMFLVYQQRSNRGGDFIFDSRISKQIKQYMVFLKIDNLFNHAYTEKGNIPMPGRWMFLGLEGEW